MMPPKVHFIGQCDNCGYRDFSCQRDNIVSCKTVSEDAYYSRPKAKCKRCGALYEFKLEETGDDYEVTILPWK